MKVQTSGEDYLKAMLVLEKRTGDAVRSVDLARYQNVSKPSVTHAVAVLKKEGLLTMDEQLHLHLTDQGREIAEKIYERHCFFTKELIAVGVDSDTAAEDACKIEHAISDVSFQRFKEAKCTE